MKDPVGYYAAILADGLNLPNRAFREAVSDAKGTHMVKSLAKVDQGINWKQLLPSQVDKSVLRTKDPASLTGIREQYPITSFVGGSETLGAPPALCFFMPFELLPSLYGEERSIEVAFLEYTCHLDFMQRRTDTLSASFKNDSALEAFLCRAVRREVTIAPTIQIPSVYQLLVQVNSERFNLSLGKIEPDQEEEKVKRIEVSSRN